MLLLLFDCLQSLPEKHIDVLRTKAIGDKFTIKSYQYRYTLLSKQTCMFDNVGLDQNTDPQENSYDFIST